MKNRQHFVCLHRCQIRKKAIKKVIPLLKLIRRRHPWKVLTKIKEHVVWHRVHWLISVCIIYASVRSFRAKCRFFKKKKNINEKKCLAHWSEHHNLREYIVPWECLEKKYILKHFVELYELLIIRHACSCATPNAKKTWNFKLNCVYLKLEILNGENE